MFPRDRLARWLGVVAIVLGTLTISGVGFVRSVVLADDTYRNALDRTNAYERVYTEVLADPALAELQEQLLGRLTPVAGSSDVRALANSALRWTVPPARLREAVEFALGQALAYVRGESPRLDGTVTVADLIDRVPATAVTVVRTVLADTSESVARTLGGYDLAVQRFADELAAGRIPAAVPVYGGTEIDAERLVDVIVAAFGDRLDTRTTAQVATAVYADDARSALIAAAASVVAEYAQDATAQLRDSTIAARDLDIVAEIADRSRVAPARVVEQFNAVRSVASFADLGTAVAGGILVFVGAALVSYGVSTRRRVRLVLTLSVAGGGVLFLGLARLAMVLVRSPLEPATSTGSGSWHLPYRLRKLLSDVSADLTDQMHQRVLAASVLLVVAGLLGAAISELPYRYAAFTPRRVALAAATAAVALIAGWSATLSPARVSADPGCNGMAGLCDLRYDEVVYAASHNAMSSPDVVYLWPEQDHDLRTQLDHGIRALLLDTHYWEPLATEEQLAVLNPVLTPELAARVFARLGRLREGREGTYLCHSHCAFGALALVDGLREIARFLDENPREVVTLVLQNSITADDTAAAFEEAGLDELLHVQPEGDEWPTLGEMIDSGRRLVVFSEFDGPPPDWYHHAYDYMQATPFQYRRVTDFGCVTSRGPQDASLLMVNHWITRSAPDRADAAVVNAPEVIVERAHLCLVERGQMPNFIAVNFANVGDVTGAVAALNTEVLAALE